MRRVGTLGLVAALAAILVSPLPAHAEDASGAVTYNAGNGYSFEKLSHPTVGTSQPDGTTKRERTYYNRTSCRC